MITYMYSTMWAYSVHMHAEQAVQQSNSVMEMVEHARHGETSNQRDEARDA